MEYDFDYLSRTHGFNVREIEKTCRISDVLEDVASVRFLGERLSLYGGTALNLIYFEGIPRLSVNLDFNYRHKGNRDWGEVRGEVDKRLKLLTPEEVEELHRRKDASELGGENMVAAFYFLGTCKAQCFSWRFFLSME